MIEIKKSTCADSRSCDYTKVSKEDLYFATKSHISDVRNCLDFFRESLLLSGKEHDYSKIDNLDLFHSEFKKGFQQNSFLKLHYSEERHHLLAENGVRDDVTLIDVLEFIADNVAAGKARSGEVWPMQLSSEVLQKAFNNTVDLLKRNTIQVGGASKIQKDPDVCSH